MFKIFKELVDKITDEKQKSDFLTELKRIEESNLITKPENLDTFLNDEKFTDLKSQYDKNISGLRTKWDSDLKELKLKDNIEKSEGAESNATEKLLKEMMAGMNEKFEQMNNDISGLRGEKTVDSLKNYAKEKLKDIPEGFHNFIHISESTTQPDIDKEIELLITARENDLKGINGQPNVGQGKAADGGVAEIHEILDEKLGTEKEK